MSAIAPADASAPSRRSQIRHSVVTNDSRLVNKFSPNSEVNRKERWLRIKSAYMAAGKQVEWKAGRTF